MIINVKYRVITERVRFQRQRKQQILRVLPNITLYASCLMLGLCIYLIVVNM